MSNESRRDEDKNCHSQKFAESAKSRKRSWLFFLFVSQENLLRVFVNFRQLLGVTRLLTNVKSQRGSAHKICFVCFIYWF